MALTAYGTTGVYLEPSQVVAKSAITEQPNYGIFTFNVLVQGQWINLKYASQSAAQSDWNSFT